MKEGAEEIGTKQMPMNLEEKTENNIVYEESVTEDSDYDDLLEDAD
jgi:hypothetical protein